MNSTELQFKPFNLTSSLNSLNFNGTLMEVLKNDFDTKVTFYIVSALNFSHVSMGMRITCVYVSTFKSLTSKRSNVM